MKIAFNETELQDVLEQGSSIILQQYIKNLFAKTLKSKIADLEKEEQEFVDKIASGGAGLNKQNLIKTGHHLEKYDFQKDVLNDLIYK